DEVARAGRPRQAVIADRDDWNLSGEVIVDQVGRQGTPAHRGIIDSATPFPSDKIALRGDQPPALHELTRELSYRLINRLAPTPLSENLHFFCKPNLTCDGHLLPTRPFFF